MHTSLRAASLRLLRTTAIRRAALTVAAARERALIILYHRVIPASLPDEPAAGHIVPTVVTTLFRQHLEALSAIADFVPLSELIGPPAKASPATARRVRLALSFDDDDPAHARYALPILQTLGIPATFFVSGRALHGLSPPWWIRLEERIRRVGLDSTAAQLGVSARTAADLAAACEGTQLVEVIERTFPAPEERSLLARDEIRLLTSAGMTVGFHTLDHPVLTQLPDAEVVRALHVGREALADAAGKPVDLFAYPHGSADLRIAGHVRAAGYRAAFQTGGRPIGRTSDPFLLGRWEAGPLSVQRLIAEVALRLSYPLGAPRRSSSPASDGRVDEGAGPGQPPSR